MPGFPKTEITPPEFDFCIVYEYDDGAISKN
jgi:hypothetical protein